MPQIKLVIFDCDGVLVDSEYLAARHESRRYGEHGFEVSVAEFSGRFAGMTGEFIARDIEAELGRKLPNGLYREIDRELDEILEREIEAVAGIAHALDKIGLPRCICSNSGPKRLEMMLKRTGLHDAFRPHIFSAKELDPPAPKPSPAIFLHGMRQFNALPRETLIIEDSVFGVAAAKAAGARIIGFTGGKHTWRGHAERLVEAGAETIIASHALLPGTIDAFHGWEGFEGG